MSYQRFNKGGRVAKSPFSAKSVQKSLNKKIKKSELKIGEVRYDNMT